jgi:hypothetical protein
VGRVLGRLVDLFEGGGSPGGCGVSERRGRHAHLTRAQRQPSSLLGNLDVEEVGAHPASTDALVVLGAALRALDLLAHPDIIAWRLLDRVKARHHRREIAPDGPSDETGDDPTASAGTTHP